MAFSSRSLILASKKGKHDEEFNLNLIDHAPDFLIFSHHRNICTRRKKKVLSSLVWWQNVKFVSSMGHGKCHQAKIEYQEQGGKEATTTLSVALFCQPICYQLSVKRTKRMSNIFLQIVERGGIILSWCCWLILVLMFYVEAKFNEQMKIAVKNDTDVTTSKCGEEFSTTRKIIPKFLKQTTRRKILSLWMKNNRLKGNYLKHDRGKKRRANDKYIFAVRSK